MNTNYRYAVQGLCAPDEEGRVVIDNGYFTVLREAIACAKQEFKKRPSTEEMHVFQVTGTWDEGYVVHSEWDALFSRYNPLFNFDGLTEHEKVLRGDS